eukprot:scaffold6532_cov116-Isochrysis_galbana.AAC.5
MSQPGSRRQAKRASAHAQYPLAAIWQLAALAVQQQRRPQEECLGAHMPREARPSANSTYRHPPREI